MRPAATTPLAGQANQTRNPRSTVATATELYDFMRLLWARAGRTYCPNDGTRIQRDTVDQAAETMLSQAEGSTKLHKDKLLIGSAILRGIPAAVVLEKQFDPALGFPKSKRILEAIFDSGIEDSCPPIFGSALEDQAIEPTLAAPGNLSSVDQRSERLHKSLHQTSTQECRVSCY